MTQDARHIFHSRNEVALDCTGHRAHTRAEVRLDQSGYRGTTRGIVHREAPARRRDDRVADGQEQ